MSRVGFGERVGQSDSLSRRLKPEQVSGIQFGEEIDQLVGGDTGSRGQVSNGWRFSVRC
jgi:hypothetical protein